MKKIFQTCCRYLLNKNKLSSKSYEKQIWNCCIFMYSKKSDKTQIRSTWLGMALKQHLLLAPDGYTYSNLRERNFLGLSKSQIKKMDYWKCGSYELNF